MIITSNIRIIEGFDTPLPEAKGKGIHQYKPKNIDNNINDPKVPLTLNDASGKHKSFHTQAKP